MKTRITDLVQDCCPEAVLIGGYDEALASRIEARVHARLETAAGNTVRRWKLPRALLLAAALILAVGTVAFAVAEYTMSTRKPSKEDELVAGFRYEEVVDGKVKNSKILVYPDAGMVFTFSCPEAVTHAPEFRCFWLPQDATEGITDEQGWTTRLFCDEGNAILYSISAIEYVRDGTQLVLSGDVDIVKEDRLGGWQITEVTSDCSKLIFPKYDRANYILLFQKTTGNLILISGELDMETLEHIAYEMEIRESSTPKAESNGDSLIGTIDLGRG